MTRILIMDGNPRASRESGREDGVRQAAETYANVISRYFPDVQTDIVYAADKDGAIPHGAALTDYDGFIVGGSGLHAYDTNFEVMNQIALLNEAAEVGLPILGSCWGLQIAAIAAGGSVRKSPKGQELGVARKIQLTHMGERHPIFKDKSPVFDALCIHYDEIENLPEGSTLLAYNAHSDVQAAIIPLAKSNVWAVQYHPEFELDNLRMLINHYRDDMIEGGLFTDHAMVDAHVADYARLAADGADMAAAWRLGIDNDILDHAHKCAEIRNWVESCVLK